MCESNSPIMPFRLSELHLNEFVFFISSKIYLVYPPIQDSENMFYFGNKSICFQLNCIFFSKIKKQQQQQKLLFKQICLSKTRIPMCSVLFFLQKCSQTVYGSIKLKRYFDLSFFIVLSIRIYIKDITREKRQIDGKSSSKLLEPPIVQALIVLKNTQQLQLMKNACKWV